MFTALVYGSPHGYEELFAKRIDSIDEDWLSEFNAFVATFSQESIYQRLGDLLAPPNDPAQSVTLWIAHRVALIGEQRPQNAEEMLFTGIYRHAYELTGKRSGFYGAGHWFNRHHISIPGKTLQSRALITSKATWDLCGMPLGQFSTQKSHAMFSTTLADRRNELWDVMSGLEYRANRKVRDQMPCVFLNRSTAFIQLLPSEAEMPKSVTLPSKFDSLQVVDTFLNQVVKAEVLLRFQTIFACASPLIAQTILEGGAFSGVPPDLQNAPMFTLNVSGSLKALNSAAVEVLRELTELTQGKSEKKDSISKFAPATADEPPSECSIGVAGNNLKLAGDLAAFAIESPQVDSPKSEHYLSSLESPPWVDEERSRRLEMYRELEAQTTNLQENRKTDGFEDLGDGWFDQIRRRKVSEYEQQISEFKDDGSKHADDIAISVSVAVEKPPRKNSECFKPKLLLLLLVILALIAIVHASRSNY